MRHPKQYLVTVAGSEGKHAAKQLLSGPVQVQCYLICCNDLGFLVDSSMPLLNVARKKAHQLLLVGEDFCSHVGP